MRSKKLIKKGGFHRTGVLMPLDPEKLIYSFYKKQDYEPFAVPFGFPVLDDLNWKIELKKIYEAGGISKIEYEKAKTFLSKSKETIKEKEKKL